MSEIRIRVVDNGYVLEDWDNSIVDSEGGCHAVGEWKLTGTRVFENGDTESEDLQAFIRLVYALNDSIAPTTGRYSPERLIVKTEPGDKYEEPNEEINI